jgi:GxxExxY protein
VQVPVPLLYEGICVERAYRIDLLVEQAVVVELKVAKKLHPIHEAQLLSYLKLTQLRLGLLINFNVARLRHGIKRMVYNL